MNMHVFSVLDKLLQTQTKNNHTVTTHNNNKKNNNFQEKKVEEPKNSDFADETKYDSCYVLWVKDGDTFVGMHNNEKKTFRLAGINTPEKGFPWSKEATDFLKEKINKKVVYLTFLGEDPYDRYVVEVFLDKEKTQNVNKMLLKEGLATSERYKNTDGKNTHNFLNYAKNEIIEKIAQVKGNGMWSDSQNSTIQDQNKTFTKKKLK